MKNFFKWNTNLWGTIFTALILIGSLGGVFKYAEFISIFIIIVMFSLLLSDLTKKQTRGHYKKRPKSTQPSAQDETQT